MNDTLKNIVVFPKQKFAIRDIVTLRLTNLTYDGTSFRNKLLRRIIKNLYDTYHVNKLTPNFKRLAKERISVVDNCEYAYIVGVEAFGNLSFEFSPCNICYTNGSYKGLDAYSYKILVHAHVDMNGKTNHVQFTIPHILSDEIKAFKQK